MNACLAACLLASIVSLAQPQARTPARKAVATRVAEVLDAVKADDDLPDAAVKLRKLFDEVITFSPATDPDAFRDAAYGVRLASQLGHAPAGKRADLLAFLRANDALAQSLVFLVKPEDKLSGVYTLLDRLRERHPDLGNHASLAAALCVVHDQPHFWRVNENKVDAPDPLDLFVYFKTQKRQMAMPTASMPAELLVWVVDVAANMDDLRWAGQTYAGDLNVGQRYFDVKYDHDAFRKGSVKKVTAAGFSLRNVLTHGGVCADQAYFAAHVGKSIGVPTAYIFGRNAEVSHAWVGYLEAKGGKAAWNFNSGRYQGYQGVRGLAIDPQTRKRITDSELALMAEATATNAQARRSAVAMTDAAIRLRELAGTGSSLPAGATGRGERKPARGTGVADRLALLEAGLRRCPTYAPGWAVLSQAAREGELSLKDKKQWADVLDRLCAGKYPDFSLDVLRPMVETVENPRDQDALWNSLFNSYRARPDLGAEIRFAQGAMWEKAGDRARAWDCYHDIIERFADDGPFTVDAAQRCESLLKDSHKERDIVPLYASLWARLAQPQGMAPEFQAQSNWFRIGLLYAAHLESGGLGSRADEVRGKLGVPKK